MAFEAPLLPAGGSRRPSDTACPSGAQNAAAWIRERARGPTELGSGASAVMAVSVGPAWGSFVAPSGIGNGNTTADPAFDSASPMVAATWPFPRCRKSGHYKPTESEVLAALDTLLGHGVMHGDAVVKPGFGAQDWFNAAQWQSRRGVVGPADAVGRAAILNVLPAGARSAAVMKLIPPWPWLASVRRAWLGGRSRQQRCRLTCAAVSRHSSAPDSGRMPRQTDSTDRRRPAIDVAPNGEYGRRSRTGGQAPVR